MTESKRKGIFDNGAGYLAGILGVAAVTIVCALLRRYINEMTVALAMLLVVLFVASIWEYWPALLTSVAGMLCLNYYFLPPIYTFTIEDPKNWVALTAFFIVTVVAGRLSALNKQKAAEARRTGAYNRSLIEASLDALVTIGRDGKITDLNAATESLTGCTRKELIGTDFSDYFLETEKAREGYRQVFRKGFVRDFPLEVRRRDGRTVPVLYNATIYRDESGEVGGVFAAARDVTELRRAETSLRLLARLQAVLAELGQEALRREPSEKVLEEAVARAAQLLGVDYARVLELLPDGKTLLLRAGYGWKPGVVGQATVSAGPETQAGFTLISKEPVILEDLSTEKRFGSVPMFGDPPVTSGMSAVISTSDGPYGIFSVHTRERRTFTTDEVNFLQGVANVLGTMIERQRAEDALRKSADEIRDLYNHAPCGYHSLDKDGVFVQINDTELSWLGYTRGEVIGKMNFAAVITPESLRLFEQSFPKFKAQGVIRDLEFNMIRKDGSTLPVLLSATAVTDSAGHYLMSRSTIYDITARKHAENEIRMLAHLQSVVADLGERALRGASLSQVLDDATYQVTQALGVEYCKVLELLPTRDALLMVSGAGWKPGYVGHAVVGMGRDSQAGYTLLSGQPVIVEDLTTEKRFSGTALLHEHEVLSGATVVIPTNEGPYGVLGAHSRRHKAFRADEVNFLQAVANVLGSAIERHRNEAQLWRVNQAQRVLSKCNEALIRATEEAGLLQRICDLIVEEAGYRFCWVGRAESDEAKSVRPVAQAGFEAGYLGTLNVTWADTDRGRGPTGTCIRMHQTTVMKRIASDSRMQPWRSEALKRGYASSVAIPLMFDSSVFGALTIYAAEPDAFRDEEVSLLGELASDLAFGIQTLRTREERAKGEAEIHKLNAELEQRVIRRTAELQAANQELEQAREREIEIGFRIQQTLLLDRPPENVAGLRVVALSIPSQRIDGDFYIFIRHSEHCLDVIVGDVMGKGVPAALLGAATKSHFLRALSDLIIQSRDGKLPEPKEIVMLAHAGLARHLIELDSFVTLVYARLDANSRRVDLVDCGHTGTIHLHGRSGLCDTIRGENLPLGVREGELYEQISVPLEAGDLLLFYSDGITEARDSAGDLFGAERLEQYVRLHRALDPAALVEQIRKDVSAFSGTDRLTDDLTMVAVKVEEVETAIARARIEIESNLKNLSRAREFVRQFCANLVGKDCAVSLELAVNEAASNIMKHAYHGRADQRIEIEAEAFPSRISIRLHHYGDPFDPAKLAPPPLDGSRDSGFGVYIISRSVDEVGYHRDERGRNCVYLMKRRKPN